MALGSVIRVQGYSNDFGVGDAPSDSGNDRILDGGIAQISPTAGAEEDESLRNCAGHDRVNFGRKSFYCNRLYANRHRPRVTEKWGGKVYAKEGESITGDAPEGLSTDQSRGVPEVY
jgi:hypothetical protein